MLKKQLYAQKWVITFLFSVLIKGNGKWPVRIYSTALGRENIKKLIWSVFFLMNHKEYIIKVFQEQLNIS